MNSLIFKNFSLLLALIFSFMSFNISACEKTSKLSRCTDNKPYSTKRYSAARTLARYSLGLRVLKWSRCTNKVKVTDNADADLSLIQKTLSRDGRFRFSRDVMAFKKYSNGYIKKKINESKKITGNIDKICRSLESEYKGRYKKAKREYYHLIGKDLK